MDGFNDKSASQIAEVGKKSVVLGRNYLYKRRGRHRKSDALIDYAIYNILKSGKAVSPIVVHRELSKNPLYNLSERTLRRRLAEFGNSRNALASRRPRSCEPVVDKISDNASFNSVINIDSTFNDVINNDAFLYSLQMTENAQTSQLSLGNGRDPIELSSSTVSSNNAANLLALESKDVKDEIRDCYGATSAFSAFEPSRFLRQNQNQTEVAEEKVGSSGCTMNDNEDLQAMLEANFALLSREGIEKFMMKLHSAIQQHRQKMASKAAEMMRELPANIRLELLDHLKDSMKNNERLLL